MSKSHGHLWERDVFGLDCTTLVPIVSGLKHQWLAVKNRAITILGKDDISTLCDVAQADPSITHCTSPLSTNRGAQLYGRRYGFVKSALCRRVSKYNRSEMWSGNKPSASQIIFAITLVALGFYLAIALIKYVQIALAALTFPFPLDYGEGPVLEQTIRLAHLENIYSNDLSNPPYTVSNYPPLYQLIQIPFALLFGPAFMYGRLISILSAIAAAVLVGAILYILTSDLLASAIGGLLLLAFPFVVQWSIIDRVDTFGLVLSLLGLYVVLRSPVQ